MFLPSSLVVIAASVASLRAKDNTGSEPGSTLNAIGNMRQSETINKQQFPNP